jgi:hypothetical protein
LEVPNPTILKTEHSPVISSQLGLDLSPSTVLARSALPRERVRSSLQSRIGCAAIEVASALLALDYVSAAHDAADRMPF